MPKLNPNHGPSSSTPPLWAGGYDARCANQGTRNLKEESEKKGGWIWPASLREPVERAWALMRLTRPRFDNPSKFWSYVPEGFKGRLIVVATVNDLRLS